MKKFLTFLLLVAFVVSPLSSSFAKELDDDEVENGRWKLQVKAGYVANQRVTVGVEDVKESSDLNGALSLGADFGYGIASGGFLFGLGIDHVFNANAKDSDGKVSLGYTNIYLLLQFGIPLNGDFFTDIYIPMQLGYAMVSTDNNSGMKVYADDGMCYGFGLGTTIKRDFFVEMIFSFIQGPIKTNKHQDFPDWGQSYSSLKMNVGYRFSFGKSISSKNRFKGKE